MLTTISKPAHVLDLHKARLGGAHLLAANDPRGVTECVDCHVCGGPSYPDDNGLCGACRGLAATFATAAERSGSAS